MRVEDVEGLCLRERRLHRRRRRKPTVGEGALVQARLLHRRILARDRVETRVGGVPEENRGRLPQQIAGNICSQAVGNL